MVRQTKSPSFAQAISVTKKVWCEGSVRLITFQTMGTEFLILKVFLTWLASSQTYPIFKLFCDQIVSLNIIIPCYVTVLLSNLPSCLNTHIRPLIIYYKYDNKIDSIQFLIRYGAVNEMRMS